MNRRTISVLTLNTRKIEARLDFSPLHGLSIATELHRDGVSTASRDHP